MYLLPCRVRPGFADIYTPCICIIIYVSITLQGESRFVCSTGERKLFMTILAAAGVLQPVLDVVDSEFSAPDIRVSAPDIRVSEVMDIKEWGGGPKCRGFSMEWSTMV